MKHFITLILFFATLTVFGQQWRDSLETARNLYRKGDYEKALKYYESAQKSAPEGVDLSDEMGQSAYKLRDFERAEKIYRQSASEKKNSASRARSFHNLGNSCMKKKDYQGAVDAYRQALRNDPSNEKTRYNLSEAMRRMKQEEDKKKDQQKDQNQDQQDQDQQNKNNQGKNDQNQKNQGGQQGNQSKNNGQNGKDQQSNNKGKNGQNKSGLPNRSVDRMLDELMKAEAATKRKMGGSQGEGSTTSSGKDW